MQSFADIPLETGSTASRLVACALERSLTRSQVRRRSSADHDRDTAVLVLGEAGMAARDPEELLHGFTGKLLLLGALPAAWKKLLGAREAAVLDPALFRAEIREDRSESVSALRLVFRQGPEISRQAWGETRYAERFDFRNEWNNDGYGRMDSLACSVEIPEERTIAFVEKAGKGRVAAAAGLWDFPRASILWWNRAIGPSDGFDWSVVENWISDHRAGELPCLPVLTEVPKGYDAACNIRLDCDQDIASSKPLFDFYAREKIPFSFAVVTNFPYRPQDDELIARVVQAGGSMVSHSHTHPVDWGGSPEASQAEFTESKRVLEARYPLAGAIRDAVSPFHQNSLKALDGLKAGGIRGIVTGIIFNDPEALFARSGPFPFHPEILELVAQCMMHGETYRRQHCGLDFYLRQFELRQRNRTLFGYLDHPLSSTYQYGWESVEEQVDAHSRLVAGIRKRAEKVLWLSTKQAFDWLSVLHSGSVSVEGDRPKLHFQSASGLVPVARWKGKLWS